MTERCHTAWVVRAFRCTQTYQALLTQDDEVYAPSRFPAANITGYEDSGLSDFEQAFVFSSALHLHGDVYEATYSGGGYVANLGETWEQASDMISNLSASNWIDQYTRAAYIEFSMCNPSSTLFNLAMIIFEYPPDGNTIWSARMEVVQLFRYSPPAGPVALLSEILCTVIVLVMNIVEVRQMVKHQHRYFNEMWNIVQLLNLALFYVAV